MFELTDVVGGGSVGARPRFFLFFLLGGGGVGDEGEQLDTLFI